MLIVHIVDSKRVRNIEHIIRCINARNAESSIIGAEVNE